VLQPSCRRGLICRPWRGPQSSQHWLCLLCNGSLLLCSLSKRWSLERELWCGASRRAAVVGSGEVLRSQCVLQPLGFLHLHVLRVERFVVLCRAVVLEGVLVEFVRLILAAVVHVQGVWKYAGRWVSSSFLRLDQHAAVDPWLL